MRRKKANCFSNKYFEFRGRWKGGGGPHTPNKNRLSTFSFDSVLGRESFFLFTRCPHWVISRPVLPGAHRHMQ